MTATYQAFSSRRGRGAVPGSETSGWSVAQQARQVRAAAGSQRAAAAQMGVSVATFRRWESGKVQTPKVGTSLAQAAKAAWRRARMTPAREARLRRRPPWQMAGEIRTSNEVRHRTIRPGKTRPEGNLNDALDAYLAGDDVAAAAEIDALVNVYVNEGALPGRTISSAIEDVDAGGFQLERPRKGKDGR